MRNRIVLKEDEKVIKRINVQGVPERFTNPLIMIDGEGYKIRNQIENFVTTSNTLDVELIVDVEKSEASLELQRLKDKRLKTLRRD